MRALKPNKLVGHASSYLELISQLLVVINISGAEPVASQLDRQVRRCVSFLSKTFKQFREACQKIEKNYYVK